MSRPQFRKRSRVICINPQDHVPRYSMKTGARITFSGSASAYVRQAMRRRTPEQDRHAEQFLAEHLGIRPETTGVGEIQRLQLEAMARLVTLQLRIR